MEIADFLPELFLDCPGVPEAAALNALRNAMREFCVHSAIWRVELDPIMLKQGVATYDLEFPIGAELAHIIWVKRNGHPLTVNTALELDEKSPGWRSATGNDVCAVVVEPKTLRVYPIPEADFSYGIDVSAALRPTLVSTTCGDALGRWNETIVAGALARLKGIPSKPWSDREAVPFYERAFRVGMGAALAESLLGYSRRAQHVKPRRFGY